MSDTFSWETDIYAQGKHLNRYPYDSVVQFVFRYAPRDMPRGRVRILEVGCGAGNNLWFAAREGFSVAGVDISETAVAHARERLAAEGLAGDLRVGGFEPLPWQDGRFHLVVDRGALTCADTECIHRSVAEIRRVLVPGGMFFCNLYSDQHSSCISGRRGADGLVRDIDAGSLQLGPGASLNFFSRSEMDALFVDGWDVLSLEHMVMTDMARPAMLNHAEWKATVRKRD